MQIALDFLTGRKIAQATAGAGSLGKMQITGDLKPNLDILQSQGNTNIPTTPGNGLPNTATAPGSPGNANPNFNPGSSPTPGNPATALNPGAVTPGNNIGNQLANPNNSLTPGQANLANPQSTVTPGQQATTPTPSKTPLQNIKRTIYTVHDIPSIYDTTPVLRRPLPNYTPQELEIFRNHTSDWHSNFDWNAELFDLIDGHGGNHIYDTPKMIADRILNPQPGAYIPTASSRTFDANAAEYFIKETLYHNSNIIDNWLLIPAPKEGLELKYIPSSGELTGFGIPRGGTHFMPTYNMTVVAVRTQNGYRLRTYYPGFK